VFFFFCFLCIRLELVFFIPFAVFAYFTPSELTQ